MSKKTEVAPVAESPVAESHTQALTLTVPQTLSAFVKDMNAEKALLLTKYAAVAVDYLERKAQGGVNQDADIIVEQRQAGKDADAADIFMSQKTKMKLSKTLKAIQASVVIGEALVIAEKKQKAIPAQTAK